MIKIIEKISNFLPIIGGGIGGVSRAGDVVQTASHFPSHEQIIPVVIVSIIGSICGYLVKLGLDWVIRKIKNKRHK